MIKPCLNCLKDFEGPPNKKYCSAKCKKTKENSKRSAPKCNGGENQGCLSAEIRKPPHLGGYASTYWDKLAPTLIQRGHLNILSEDSFAELCDVAGRLITINKQINESNCTLLQEIDGSGVSEESGLSDLKRKYSRLLLDYCKQFYLTPLSVRGNFGLKATEEKDPLDEFIKNKNGNGNGKK